MNIPGDCPESATLVLVNGRWIADRRRPGRRDDVSPSLLPLLRADAAATDDGLIDTAQAARAGSRRALRYDLLCIGIGVIVGADLCWGVLYYL